MNILIVTLVVGIGATAVMDVWSIARSSLLGIAAPNYGLVGRWIAYMPRGTKTTPLRGAPVNGNAY
jgi:hypothetical protein